MRSSSPSLSVPASTSAPPSLHFLIPPFARFRFSLGFILATGLGWFLVSSVLRPLHSSLLPAAWETQSLLGTFISGLVAGLMVGATQWWVLRRHLPDWLWILANSAGYVMLMTTLQAWQGLLEAGLTTLELPAFVSGLPTPVMTMASAAIVTLLAAVCSIWLGLLQWLALRPYARPCWGWAFVPAIAVLLASGLVSASLLLSRLHVAVHLEPSLLAAGILGATQAIAFCALRQKPDPALSESPLLLAIAPQIRRGGKIRRIARRVREQLKQAQSVELTFDRPLTYLVGADETGTIATYEPLNRWSNLYEHQTPLPELADPRQFERGDLPPLVQLQVTFLRSGRVQVRSWKGLSLFWLGLAMLIFVVGVSAIVGHFGLQLLTLIPT